MGVSDLLLGTKSNSKFVNRWEEMDTLKEHMKESLQGNGRFVILKGEAGVGKTRIADEFSSKCQKNDFQFLWGRCLYHESTEPYIPFIEALGDYINEKKSENTKREYLGMGISSANKSYKNKPISLVGLGSSKRSINKAKDISLSNEREVMFTNILDLVKKLSEKQPLLLFLDDLQWIDESSSQLLHLLIRNISENRVLILGAYRPEELKIHGEKKPLQTLLERTKQEGLVDIIKIERLGFQPVSDMVKNQLQTSGLPESFLLTIYKETEGNPYYVIEILNSMVEEGVIDPYSYTWDPEEELSDISIPSSIKDITNRRIERLDEREKKVLMYASVIGTEFNFEILEESIDIDVLELLDICDELVNHGIISEKMDTDEEIYRFNHLQLRLTIYENMGKTRKRILNKQIGETIEKIYKDNLERFYYSLSRHFIEGKVYGKAYDYSIKAAERAVDAYALETAIKHYKNALKSLNSSKSFENREQKEISILKTIGKLSYKTSTFDNAKNYFVSLLKLAEDISDKKSKADALRWIAHTNKESQNYQRSYDNYKEALKIYEELNDQRGSADCKRGIGYLLWRRGDFEKAIDLFEEVIETTKKIEEDNLLSLTYIEIGNAYAQKGENKKAIEYYENSVSLLKKQSAFKDLARAYNNMGDQYMKLEEWDKSLYHFQKAVKYAKKIGDYVHIGWGYFNQAEALAGMGELEKAKKYTSRSENIMNSLKDKVGLSSIYRVKALIKRREDNWDGAIKDLDKSLKYLENLDIPFVRAENKYELGRIYMDKGEPEKAYENFEKAKKIFQNLGASQYLEKIQVELEKLNH